MQAQIEWQPGGAQGNADQVFIDGEQYLFAIALADETWDIHTVVAKCDPELGCDFDTPQGDHWYDWSWSEVEWFAPCRELQLPMPTVESVTKSPSEGE